VDQIVEKLKEEVADELVPSFFAQPVVGDMSVFAITQYLAWMLLAAVLLLIVIFKFKNEQAKSLVPHGWFVNGMEFAVDFVKNDICKGTFGDGWRKHFPFLASMFFFIVAGNLIGMLPTWKPGTGSIGVTAAVATISFVYFVAMGVKHYGGWGYIKSLAPAGVMFPINLVVWAIEVFSTILRLITLAVRLLCNMLAGHIVMGVFALMCTFFVQPMLASFTAANAGLAATSIAWMVFLIVIYIIEILIAVIQAFVFTLLSAVYIQLAEAEGH